MNQLKWEKLWADASDTQRITKNKLVIGKPSFHRTKWHNHAVWQALCYDSLHLVKDICGTKPFQDEQRPMKLLIPF